MTWSTPLYAGIAAAIAIPSLIILYFLKLRRRDVEISTTLLWKKAIQDLQANAPFQKLRRNILLLLQLIVLAGLCAAIGKPEIKGESATGARHLILIDRSASMSAVDAKDDRGHAISRLDAAKQEALKFIDTLKEPGLFDKGRGDQAMVISFDVSAKALQSFTSDKDLLKAAINAIDPSDTPSSLEEAMKLVLAQAPREETVETKPDGTTSRYVRPPKPVGTIHLYSDGRLPDAAKVAPGREDQLLYNAIGSPDSVNTGIVTLRAGRAFDDPNKLSIFVGLQSTDRQARAVELECRIDNVVAGIKTVQMPAASIPAGQDPKVARPAPAVGGAVFTLERPQGGVVTVHLTPPPGDALATDDTAWLVVPPARKLAVAVVTRGDLFIASALASLPLSELRTMTPDEYERLRAGPTFNYDVIVLDGYLPTMPKNAPAPLPPGRFLILGALPTGPGGLIDKGKEDKPAAFLDWSRDHPALRNLSLDAINIGRQTLVEIPKGAAATVLATLDTGPGVVELAAGDSRSIIITFGASDSDWPFHISFPIFIAQAVGYLGDDSSGLGQMVQPGGVLNDRIPVASRDVRIQLPDRSSSPIGAPSTDGTIVYGPIQKTGIYTVNWTGKPGPSDADLGGGRAARPFAANLLDTAESDIATAPKLDLANRQVGAEQKTETKITRPLWPWFILGALAIILLEWFVYNRKVQV